MSYNIVTEYFFDFPMHFKVWCIGATTMQRAVRRDDLPRAASRSGPPKDVQFYTASDSYITPYYKYHTNHFQSAS